MDKEQLMNLLTVEDITRLVVELGSLPPLNDNNGHLIFNTICHNGAGHGSRKLWFYPETKSFYCWSECHGLTLFDLVMKVKGFVNFKDAFNFVCQFKGVSAYHDSGHRGFYKEEFVNEDLEFLNHHLETNIIQDVDLKIYDDSILDLFHKCYPANWQQEGINEETAEKFDIRYCFSRNAAIIPYRDMNNNLIGIRQRNFNQLQVEAGRKYIPATIEKRNYSYPSSQVLYGLYENQEAIRKTKEVVLVEGEKSVMLYDSYYCDRSVALGMGGSSFSLYQRELLLQLGVERVVICLDKDYRMEMLKDKSSEDYKAYMGLIRRLKKMIGLLAPYLQVAVVMCFDDRLGYKDSPLDRGKEVYESLLKEAEIFDSVDELDELLKIIE